MFISAKSILLIIFLVNTMKKFLIPPVFFAIGLTAITTCYFLVKELNVIPFPFNLLGLLIAFSGFVLAGKAHELFNKHKTTLEMNISNHLIHEGVFKRTRNPMYIAMFLFLFGISFSFGNLISIGLSILFIIIIAVVFVPSEEKMLTETFGRQYLDYKNKTRRWI
jgi:protein-S-isoprenylcysteine O-methyltransferase Ste14